MCIRDRLRYTDGSNVQDDYPWSDITREKAQFAPNFTRGWDLKIKNPNGNGGITWEPTGSLGAIGQDGLVISINHSNTASTVASPEVAVVLDSLVGTNSDKFKVSLLNKVFVKVMLSSVNLENGLPVIPFCPSS